MLLALGSFALAAGLSGLLRRMGVPFWLGLVVLAIVLVGVAAAVVWTERRLSARYPQADRAPDSPPDPP